jgi:hypothetical protein
MLQLHAIAMTTSRHPTKSHTDFRASERFSRGIPGLYRFRAVMRFAPLGVTRWPPRCRHCSDFLTESHPQRARRSRRRGHQRGRRPGPLRRRCLRESIGDLFRAKPPPGMGHVFMSDATRGKLHPLIADRARPKPNRLTRIPGGKPVALAKPPRDSGESRNRLIKPSPACTSSTPASRFAISATSSL